MSDDLTMHPMYAEQRRIPLTFTKADAITIPPDRQRKKFDEKSIRDFANELAEVGLIHPLTVEKDNTLVAGERRLRALKLLFSEGKEVRHGPAILNNGIVPIVIWENLSPAQRYALELSENVGRENLTWQEKGAALVKLHNFRSEQSEFMHSLVDTAVEAGASVNTVREALVIQRHIENPAVASADSPKEALKVIKKIEEAKHRATLAQSFDLEKTPHTLIHGDAYAHLDKLESGIFDCIITDPPYGIGADSFGDQAGTAHEYTDSPEDYEAFRNIIPGESYRLAKPEAFLYTFCDLSRFSELDLHFTLAGWKVWPRPLIWNKLGGGMLPQPLYGPRYSYECILFARKGDRRVVKSAAPDVLSYAPIKRLLHGAQKPVVLYCDLLSRVCLPGDRILDPFGGSGTGLVAANSLKLTAVVIEKEEASYHIALSRIASKEIYEDTEDFKL